MKCREKNKCVYYVKHVAVFKEWIEVNNS